MAFRLHLLIGASFLASIAGCAGGGSEDRTPPPPVSRTYTAASGVAQKGPLILGSTVTAQELTATLVPNGKQYSYQTNSDLGTFNPSSAFTSQYIGVSATGYYFDEVTNALSSGTITLNAYGNIDANPALNVNLLTTLAYQRIETLVKAGSTFAAAQTQAEREVLTGLAIVGADSDVHFGTLDLSKGTSGDKLLAAVSSLFVYGNNSANLAALIANFQSDLAADGVIDSPTVRATLLASAHGLNPAAVAANLNQKYAAQSVTYSAADIGGWLDQDGDGLIDKFEYSVADASQSSQFSVPAAVVTANVGASVSVANGILTVNGTIANAPRQLAAGDVVTISPLAGVFPGGVQTVYLTVGSTKIARVSFVSGLASIEVTPGEASLPKGLNLAYLAVGTYTDGSTSDISGSVNWSTDAAPIASIASNTGLATGNGLGTATISANLGSITGSTTLHVVTPKLMSMAIEPATVQVVLGRTQRVAAVGTYSDDTQADISSIVTWDVGNTSVATVTGGLLSGVALGNTTVSASTGTLTASRGLNTVNNGWSPTGSLRTARRAHSATLLNDGRVLVAGGLTGDGTQLTSAEIYDPATESWSSAGDMSLGRFNHSAIRLASGKVLVVGGSSVDPSLWSETYDPSNNTWTPVGPMLAWASGRTLTLLADGVLAVSYTQGSAVNAQIYSPSTNGWTAAAPLHHPRSGHSATLLPDGRVLVSGGSIPGANAIEPTSEIFDPAAGNWTDAGAMIHGGWGSSTVMLPNGKALATGGALPFPQLFTSTETFDPATLSWTLGASMKRSRESHTALVLPTGQVLAVGGWYDFQPAYTISELYDAASSQWSDTATMISSRAECTVTLLGNGKVLAAGGTLDRTGVVLATAELFDYVGNPN